MKKTKLTILMSVFLSALTTVSCKDNSASKPSRTTAETDNQASDTKKSITKPEATKPKTISESPKGTPTIVLEKNGAEPRIALRLTPEIGKVQTISLKMGLSMELNMNGTQVPKNALPTTMVTMEVKVAKIDDNKDIHWDFKYTDVKVEASEDVLPEILKASQDATVGLVGITGNGVINSRGVLLKGDFDIPDSVSPQMKQTLEGMRQSLSQLTVPFPKEKVGVGAQWQVIQKITQNGITIDQITNFEVMKLKGTEMVAKLSLNQTADPQIMKNDKLPPNVTAHLKSLNSRGNGETHFDLNKILPNQATLDLDMEMNSEMKIGDQAQTMSMRMRMNMDISTEK